MTTSFIGLTSIKLYKGGSVQGTTTGDYNVDDDEDDDDDDDEKKAWEKVCQVAKFLKQCITWTSSYI